jgi:hypothetical protein
MYSTLVSLDINNMRMSDAFLLHRPRFLEAGIGGVIQLTGPGDALPPKPNLASTWLQYIQKSNRVHTTIAVLLCKSPPQRQSAPSGRMRGASLPRQEHCA